MSTPSNQHVNTLETIISNQAAMIAALEQRILTIESRPLPETHTQLIETAVNTALAQFTSRIESSIAQQTQLMSQLIQCMQERKGGSAPIFTPPPVAQAVASEASTIMTPSIASHIVPPHWISESLIFKALQTWCTSPYIPVPLVTQHSSFTASSVAAMHRMLRSHNSSDVLGVVFAGDRHWQPVIFKTSTRSVTLYDVPGQLQHLTPEALAAVLPGWRIIIESLDEYLDGECGVVAVEVLVSTCQKCAWSQLTAHVIQQRRMSMEQLHSIDTKAFTTQYIGGSWIQSSTTSTVNSTLPLLQHVGRHHADDPMASVPPNPTASNPLMHSNHAHDDMHHGITTIGSMQGTDIRMATFNINALHEDKLPFLAWLFVKCELDILCLQDTRIPRDKWRSMKNIAAELFPTNTLFLHASPAPSTNTPISYIGGVAIIVSSRCCTGPSFRGDPLECGAICGYSCNTTLGRILIISTYFPMRSPDLHGSLWYKIAQALPRTTSLTPLQHLLATADAWSALEEASAGTFLLGALNASIGANTSGGCHNIQA